MKSREQAPSMIDKENNVQGMAPSDACYALEPPPDMFFSTLLGDLTPQCQIRSRPLLLGEARPLPFLKACSMWKNEVSRYVFTHCRTTFSKLRQESCTKHSAGITNVSKCPSLNPLCDVPSKLCAYHILLVHSVVSQQRSCPLATVSNVAMSMGAELPLNSLGLLPRSRI